MMCFSPFHMCVDVIEGGQVDPLKSNSILSSNNLKGSEFPSGPSTQLSISIKGVPHSAS